MNDYAADVDAVKAKVFAIWPEAIFYTVSAFVHQGEPVPWARAGTVKGRHFTPTKVRNAERDLAYCFRTAVRNGPLYSNVGLVAMFYRSTRQPVDVDNLLKCVLDAGNQSGVWVDDRQVTAFSAFLELDVQYPRTVVAVVPVTGSLDRTVPMKKRRSHQLFGDA